MSTLTAKPRSARIALLFVLLAGVPVVTLSWLGWRLLQQDQALGEQQQREQLENAATLLTRALDARLQEIEQRLGADPRVVADMLPGAAVVAVTGDGVSGRAGRPLPFYPHVAADEVSTAVFVAAEAVEFRERDLRRAANLYRALSEAAEPRLRAAALVRQGRALRQDQRSGEALAVYDALAGLSGTWVAGAPAELVARRERAALLTLSGRVDEAARERQALAVLLDSGRYPIDRATFEFFGASAGTVRSADREALAMAAALEDSWPRWPLERSGRLAGTFDKQPLILVWRRTGPDAAAGAAVVAPAASVLSAMSGLVQNLPVSVRVEDVTGAPAWGQTLPDGPRLSRLARESGLPWTLHVAPSDPRGIEALARRRQLFAAGLAFLVLAMTAAGFVIFRSVNRELTLARQQSAFVATVSHEFRTPLTAMAHLTELLEEGAGSPARLPEYYAALARETRRLRDLVENVLARFRAARVGPAPVPHGSGRCARARASGGGGICRTDRRESCAARARHRRLPRARRSRRRGTCDWHACRQRPEVLAGHGTHRRVDRPARQYGRYQRRGSRPGHST